MEDVKKAAEPELFPLDETTIGMVAELRQQTRDAQVAENARLSRFLREHKMKGNWRLAPHGRELMKAVDIPLPTPQA